MPDQARRQIEQQFINQAFAHQRAIELEPGFSVHLVDATASKRFKQILEFDLAGRIGQN